jgi:hypothetical protein
VKPQSRRFIWMRIQNLKSRAFDCINFEPDFFEVNSVRVVILQTAIPLMRGHAWPDTHSGHEGHSTDKRPIPSACRKFPTSCSPNEGRENGLSQEIGNEPNGLARCRPRQKKERDAHSG